MERREEWNMESRRRRGNGEISILLQKINRLLLHFWLLEGRIRLLELSITGRQKNKPYSEFIWRI